MSNRRKIEGSLRPYIGKNGRIYITLYKGKNPRDPDSYVIEDISPIQ